MACVVDSSWVEVYSTVDGGRLVRFPEQKAPVYAVAVDKGGRRVAAGGVRETVIRFDPPEDSELRLGPGRKDPGVLGYGRDVPTPQAAKEEAFRLLQLPTFGSNVFPTHEGGRVAVWDGKTGALLGDWRDLSEPVVAVGFRDGESGLVALDRRLNGWVLPLKGAARLRVEGGDAVSPNKMPSAQTSFGGGLRAASLEATSGDRGGIRIKLLDAGTRRRRVIPASGVEPPWAVAMSADGRAFATAGKRGEVALWDFDKGEVVRRVKPPNPGDGLLVCMSDDGGRVAVCCRDGRVYLWGVEDGRFVAVGEAPGPYVRAAAVGETHLTIVAGGFRADREGAEPVVVRRFDISDLLRGP